MINQFIVSRSFLKFLVTINAGKVKIETVLPVDAQSNVSNTFASAEKMILERYLRAKKITQNLHAEVMAYYTERQWSITQVTNQGVEAIAKKDVAA